MAAGEEAATARSVEMVDEVAWSCWASLPRKDEDDDDTEATYAEQSRCEFRISETSFTRSYRVRSG